MKLSIYKPDILGALASSICLVHCIATPFIFIAQTCSATCCETSPSWWNWIDYLFLLISYFAVYQSTKNSLNSIIKYALWSSWALFSMTIINERLHFIHLPEYVKYIAGFLLVILHLYNLKYCQCKTDKGCIHNV